MNSSFTDTRLPNSRRGKFRRHSNNLFSRPKRNNRISNYYNKVYVPSNWSVRFLCLFVFNTDLKSDSLLFYLFILQNQEAPDELAQNTKNVESETITTPTPSIEQCDVS